MSGELQVQKYYRLPWSYSDNVLSWLEPTKKCNLTCEGCYRDTSSGAHKTLTEVRSDLEVFKRYRNTDCISVAGGDPLVHPDIVAIVKMIKEMGWKPIVNTNGVALTPELLKELKKAGVVGFTFHIDTSQKRPGYRHTTEEKLNEVRQYYAELLASEGNIACSFNATVSKNTLSEVPTLMKWAQKNADIVHTMVFILYRSPELSGEFDYYVNGEKIRFGTTYKESIWGGHSKVKATDIVAKFREVDPTYDPCAYLNGTSNPESTKWLLASRIISGGQVMGYVSPRFMEVTQTLNHLLYGRYLGYASPKTTSRARLWVSIAGIWDKQMRAIAKRLILGQGNLFKKAHLQSILAIQPVDIREDGRQDMCDGCPDITVYKGKLVWSCRLEEMENYGAFVTAVPKGLPLEKHSSPPEVVLR